MKLNYEELEYVENLIGLEQSPFLQLNTNKAYTDFLENIYEKLVKNEKLTIGEKNILISLIKADDENILNMFKNNIIDDFGFESSLEFTENLIKKF